MEDSLLDQFLEAIDLRISEVKEAREAYNPPVTENTDEMINAYLDYRRRTQVNWDTMRYLHDLRCMMLDEKADREILAQQQIEEEQHQAEEDQAKNTQSEIKKLVKKLDKLDPISPEATRTLQKLSNLRRLN